MKTDAREVLIRIATPDDGEGMFSVLKGCAEEIPVRMDGSEREVRLRKRIRQGCLTGMSYVGAWNNKIVCFLLVSRGLAEGQFELDYGGVLRDYRAMGLFRHMLDEVKGRSDCLDATVKNANRSEMADKLLKLGFFETNFIQSHDERAFRWFRSLDITTNFLRHGALK